VQAGNADDVLMRRLHGKHWRARAETPRGRRGRHLAVTGAALVAASAGLTGHRRVAAAAGLGWLAGTAEFASARIAPGPRDPAEVTRMLWTSAAIPPAAVWHTVRGLVRHRDVPAWGPVPDAVLFDRDGTLVVDVPYNGDPAKVRPVEGALEALDRLRLAGVPVGVVTNQSGVARGLLTEDDVAAVNRRIEQLLGPFDVWQVCPHDPAAGCECRKPRPGMVLRACDALQVHPARTVLVGDIGSDVDAATAAGASGILVPTSVTLPDEVTAAQRWAPDITAATDLILQGAW
jgi:HAD superfamily hydrolase (TIGR01662 family)